MANREARKESDNGTDSKDDASNRNVLAAVDPGSSKTTQQAFVDKDLPTKCGTEPIDLDVSSSNWQDQLAELGLFENLETQTAPKAVPDPTTATSTTTEPPIVATTASILMPLTETPGSLGPDEVSPPSSPVPPPPPPKDTTPPTSNQTKKKTLTPSASPTPTPQEDVSQARGATAGLQNRLAAYNNAAGSSSARSLNAAAENDHRHHVPARGLQNRLAAYNDAAFTSSSSSRNLHVNDPHNHAPPMSPTPRTAASLAAGGISSPKPSNNLTQLAKDEAERRRNLRETYLQPLDTAPDDGDEKRAVTDFLFAFSKTYATQPDDRTNILEVVHPESVGMYYRELVVEATNAKDKVSEKDFWQRYFFRCDELLILKEAQKREHKQRVALGRSTQSKLLYNEAGDLVGTKQGQESPTTPILSPSQQTPRSILKSSFSSSPRPSTSVGDEPPRSPALGLAQLQMLDVNDQEGDDRNNDNDGDDAASKSSSWSSLPPPELEGDDYGEEAADASGQTEPNDIINSSGAAAAAIRFVDDELNEVREFSVDVVAEHTDRLPEWWMDKTPYRTLEEVMGVENIDDMNENVVYL